MQVKTSHVPATSQVLAVCTDITRIIDLERQGQLLRSQFFSSIAHELRTPLNSILPILKLILDNLRRKPSDLSKVMQLLSIVMNSATHLQSVINDALDITRIENNRFEVFPSLFNIREVLNEVCEVMRFQIDSKGLGFFLRVGQQVPLTIVTDQQRIKQVLYNLIGNAVKFTFKG